MKKTSICLSMILAASLAGCASAPPMKPISMPVDGKNFTITSIENFHEDKIVHSANIPGGVYIVATDFMFGNYLPESKKIIRDIFIANHIKITDKIEDASVSVEFYTKGFVNPAIQAQAGNSLAIFALAVASARHGQSSGATTEKQNSGTTLSGFISYKPRLNLRGNVDPMVGPTSAFDYDNTGVTVKFHDEAGAEASYVEGLKITTQLWIDHFMVK